MKTRITATLVVVTLLAAVLNKASAAAPPTDLLADGPAGYSIACIIDKASGVPNLRRCAQLGAAQRCEHEGDFASLPSQDATAMTIVNRSDQSIKLYWLSFKARRKLYNTLEPGGRMTQKTFIGHNWLVTTQDGDCIGIFNAAPTAMAFF